MTKLINNTPMNDFTLTELKYLADLVKDDYNFEDRDFVKALYNKIKNNLDKVQKLEDAKNTVFKFASPEEYTLNTLPKAPEGTYLTFFHQANSNVKVQSKIPPEKKLKVWQRHHYELTTLATRPSMVAIKCSPETCELLKHEIIPNQLTLCNSFYNEQIFQGWSYNTDTNILYIDYGTIIPYEEQW